MRGFEIPVFKPLYMVLSWERSLRLTLWRNFTRVAYHTPMFKLLCRSVGKNPYLIGGIPQVTGHLNIVLGDNVVVHGKSSFIGAKVFDAPTLTVGNNTHLGYELTINVGRDVTIGNNVLIGAGVNLCSYDSHPINPEERHLPASPDTSKPIVIEDNTWIGINAMILKGVTVGKNSIVANGSVVMSKVPPNSLAIGNPARCFPLRY